MNRIKRSGGRAAALLLLASFVGACELDVANPNQPDRERALATSGDVESLIVSSYNAYWDVSQSNFGSVVSECGGTAWLSVLNAVADHSTSSWSNYGFARTTAEPRREFPNSTANEDSCLATNPWFRAYQGLAAAASGMTAIDQAGVEIGAGGADTPRARAWARFAQGLLHGIVGLLYDQGFVVDETVELVDEQGNAIQLPFVTYQEMTQAAVGYLQDAASIASSNTFTTPATWLNGTSLTNSQLAALAHAYIARFTVRNTRSPAERSGLDWNSVLNEINQAHTFDLAIQGDASAWWSGLKIWGSWGGVAGQLAMVDLKTVGPADQSGAYQNWIATPVANRTPFDVVTPDQRIPEPLVVPGGGQSDGCRDGLDVDHCGPSPAFIGYHEDTFLPATRGTYQLSNYSRYEQNFGPVCNYFLPNFSWGGIVCEFTQRDLDFLRAEALWRTGDAQGGADILNDYREADGSGLGRTIGPNGVSGADCVPKKPDGSCGEFLDALVYEKGLAIGLEHAGDMWADKRGWGRLAPGSIIHLPVPARELETLTLELYTFGGVGGPGAAPLVVPGDVNSILQKVKWDAELMQQIEADRFDRYARSQDALRSRMR